MMYMYAGVKDEGKQPYTYIYKCTNINFLLDIPTTFYMQVEIKDEGK